MKLFYFLWVGILSLLTVHAPIATAQTYFKDSSFPPLIVKSYTSYSSSFIHLPNNKILVNGFTNYINSVEKNFPIRLNEDGSIDDSFQPQIFGEDMPMVVGPDGKIIMYSIDWDTKSESYVRLFIFSQEGEQEKSILTELETNILIGGNFLAIQEDEKILIAQTFPDENYINKGIIRRLNMDGTLDNLFKSEDLNIAWIKQITLQHDGKILVVGSIIKDHRLNYHLIRLNADGTLDTGFSPALDNVVEISAIAIQSDGKILVGRENEILRLHSNGQRDGTFLTNQYSVRSLALQADGKIVIGSWIQDEYHYVSGYGPVIRLHPNGGLDSLFNSGVGSINQPVTALTVQSDGQILAGGSFTNFNGLPAYGAIRLNGRDGSVDPTFNLALESVGILKKAIVQKDGKFLVFGHFDTANEKQGKSLVRLNSDGAIDESFNLETEDQSFWNFTGSKISAVQIQEDQKILVGGNFRSGKNQTSKSLVRLNSDGSRDQYFKELDLPSYHVHSIAVQEDKKILVGGKQYSWNPGIFLIRLMPDGEPDPTFSVGSGLGESIQSIAIQEDGKILVAGELISYNNASANQIIRLNHDGSIDRTFTSSRDIGPVEKLAIQPDGKIVVVTRYDGNKLNFHRLNTDGSLDISFKPDFGSSFYVYSFAFQPNDQILISGYLLGGDEKLVLLNNDGSLSGDFKIIDFAYHYYDELITVGEKVVVISGNHLFLFKRNEIPLGIPQDRNSKRAKLHPNPASDYLLLEFPAADIPSKIQLYNMNGQKVPTSGYPTSFGYRIETSSIPRGMYLLQLQIENLYYNHKVILE